MGWNRVLGSTRYSVLETYSGGKPVVSHRSIMGDSPLSISDTDKVINEESYESENTFWFKTFNDLISLSKLTANL